MESGEPIVTDDILYLSVLPRTYKGDERKRQAIDEAIDIVRLLKNTDDAKLLLAVIAVANDKYMTQKQVETVEGMLAMTKLGKAIYEDLIVPDLRKAEENKSKAIALNLLAMGQSVEFVSKATMLPEAEVAALATAGVPSDV